MNALIVGATHVGKTTLIRKVTEKLKVEVVGYETVKEEAFADDKQGCPVCIYKAGTPHKFSKDCILGYVKDGSFTVVPGSFDRFVSLLEEPSKENTIMVMDEIGLMESTSPKFCAAVLEALDSGRPVIAAVKDKNSDFLDKVKRLANCRCYHITEEDREDLLPVVTAFMKSQIIL